MERSIESEEKIKNRLYTVFCGMCMGAADIVPGISGGTIAFIMGFYAKLLTSIKSFKLTKIFNNPATGFLLYLISGIALSFFLLVPLFDRILNHEIYRTYLYSGFLGLILASIVLCFKQITKWKLVYFIALLIGGALAFFLTSVDLKPVNQEKMFDVEMSYPSEKMIENYDAEAKRLQNVPQSTVIAMVSKGIISNKTNLYDRDEDRQIKPENLDLLKVNPFKIDFWLIFCGSIAVCALLLPGISGSYLLTILGCYSLVIGALADFIESAKVLVFDLEAFTVLASLSVGIVIGAIVFSRVVLWLLSHHRDLTISLMTGFMIGALQTVWPFWSYTYFLNPLKMHKGTLLNATYPVMPELNSSLSIPLFLALSGFVLVFSVEYMAKKAKAG